MPIHEYSWPIVVGMTSVGVKDADRPIIPTEEEEGL